jgi:hypothetical protein
MTEDELTADPAIPSDFPPELGLQRRPTVQRIWPRGVVMTPRNSLITDVARMAETDESRQRPSFYTGHPPRMTHSSQAGPALCRYGSYGRFRPRADVICPGRRAREHRGTVTSTRAAMNRTRQRRPVTAPP